MSVVVQVGTSEARVTEEDLQPVLAKAGLELSEPLLQDYSTLLSGLDAAIAALPDDKPVKPYPDLAKYPRTDIHIPDDTEFGAWATKVCNLDTLSYLKYYAMSNVLRGHYSRSLQNAQVPPATC